MLDSNKIILLWGCPVDSWTLHNGPKGQATGRMFSTDEPWQVLHSTTSKLLRLLF